MNAPNNRASQNFNIPTPDWDEPNGDWQSTVRQHARALPYPSTPDIASKVILRLTAAKTTTRPSPRTIRWQPLWVAGVGLALLLALWAVPPVRAAILHFVQIGAVRIWLVEPTPTAQSLPQPTPSVATAQPPTQSWLDLAGRTTLAEAAADAGFALRLPTYPADIGPPDGVFLQRTDGPFVIMVWQDRAQPDKVAYSLHILGPRAVVQKHSPSIVVSTTVNGSPAAWTQGPYFLAYGAANAESWELHYLVSGRVLIWQEDGLTYRLESDLTLEEAIRMAESLE
jgi:hypothetical protein